MNLFKNVKLVFFGLIVALGIGYVSAWTGPESIAPEGNVSAPINVGGSNAEPLSWQTKTGPLILNTLLVGDLTVSTTTGGTFSAGASLVDVDGKGHIGWGIPGAVTEVQNVVYSWMSGTVTSTAAGGYIDSVTTPFNTTDNLCIVSSFYNGGCDGGAKFLLEDSGGYWKVSVQNFGDCDNKPSVQYMCTGKDVVVPMVTVSVHTDEQVLIHLQGSTNSLTNTTRGGASLSSISYKNASVGMPSDGRALRITSLVSNNGSATALSACPTGWTPGSTALSDKMCIYQQPTSANGYETIVAIWDGAASSHTWTFTLGY